MKNELSRIDYEFYDKLRNTIRDGVCYFVWDSNISFPIKEFVRKSTMDDALNYASYKNHIFESVMETVRENTYERNI